MRLALKYPPDEHMEHMQGTAWIELREAAMAEWYELHGQSQPPATDSREWAADREWAAKHTGTPHDSEAIRRMLGVTLEQAENLPEESALRRWAERILDLVRRFG